MGEALALIIGLLDCYMRYRTGLARRYQERQSLQVFFFYKARLKNGEKFALSLSEFRLSA